MAVTMFLCVCPPGGCEGPIPAVSALFSGYGSFGDAVAPRIGTRTHTRVEARGDRSFSANSGWSQLAVFPPLVIVVAMRTYAVTWRHTRLRN